MSNPRMYPGGTVFEEVTFDPASVAAATVAEQDVSVPGITTDCVLVAAEPPAHGVAVGIAGARIKSNGTVAISFVNPTAGALNPASGTYKFAFVLYK